MSFALQKLLSFKRSHLFNVALIVCAPGVICRNWSPVLMCCILLPTFSSIRFNVVRLILRCLIRLDLSFFHGDRYGSTFILLQVDIQLCQHHLLKMLSFFHCILVKGAVGCFSSCLAPGRLTSFTRNNYTETVFI